MAKAKQTTTTKKTNTKISFNNPFTKKTATKTKKKTGFGHGQCPTCHRPL